MVGVQITLRYLSHALVGTKPELRKWFFSDNLFVLSGHLRHSCRPDGDKKQWRALCLGLAPTKAVFFFGLSMFHRWYRSWCNWMLMLMLPGVVFWGDVFFSPSELFTGQHILFSSLLQTLAFNRAKIWEAAVGFELWILERKSAASASQDSYYVPFLCCQKVEGLRALSRRNTGIALARATKRFLGFVANLVRVASILFHAEQFFRSPGSWENQ